MGKECPSKTGYINLGQSQWYGFFISFIMCGAKELYDFDSKIGKGKRGNGKNPAGEIENVNKKSCGKSQNQIKEMFGRIREKNDSGKKKIWRVTGKCMHLLQ